MMKHLLIITAAAILVMSCSSKSQKADDPLADSGRTQRTENLLTNLIALGDSSVYLFGQHDATMYGIGWVADYANDSTVHQRSDVKSVCGDHPALLSVHLLANKVVHLHLGHVHAFHGKATGGRVGIEPGLGTAPNPDSHLVRLQV